MLRDGTRLHTGYDGYRGDGTPHIRSQRTVAGGGDESISQPCFSPDGRSLVYASDRAGWSQLWCRDPDADTELRLTEECCDIATPAWIQGLRAFGFAPDGTLYFVRSERGDDALTHSGQTEARSNPSESLLNTTTWSRLLQRLVAITSPVLLPLPQCPHASLASS